jgi:hypothetical protein
VPTTDRLPGLDELDDGWLWRRRSGQRGLQLARASAILAP